MRLRGFGHPALRATHRKTLELTDVPDVTERATCVVAVGAAAEPQLPMAGPVRVSISAGAETFEFEATANSSWDPHGAAVIRRSPLRLPGTLATSATAAAADLPTALRMALRDPSVEVVVELRPQPSEPTVVLFAADATRPTDPRLAAELAAADRVIAEDPAARRLAGDRARLVTQDAATESGGRLLVVSTTHLPGRTLTAAHAEPAAASGARDGTRPALDVIGLPPALAAAAAALGDSPLVVVPDGADLRSALRDAPGHARVLVRVDDPRHLQDVLDLAARLRGRADATAARDTAPPVRTAGAAPDLPGEGPAYVCLLPLEARGADDDATGAGLDPAARAAVIGLLADGVAVAAAARALAALTGRSRRSAYAAVLALRDDSRASRQSDAHRLT